MIYEPEYFKESKKYTLEELHKAKENGEILEATVQKCDKKLTLELNLGNSIIGKIAIEDLEDTQSENIKAAAMSKVGKTIKFIVVDIENKDENTFVKCSRALVQKRCNAEYISKLRPGDIIEALALKYETYGIFCDIGCGITALLPTGKIRVPYIIDPCSENKSIKKLYAVVNKIHSDGKIELTHKELLGTWKDEVSKLHKGEIRLGKVLKEDDCGYFIMISQNLKGLAESGNNKLNPGDTVSVKILHINENRHRVKLQIIDKVENQHIFKEYDYKLKSGHINKWEYYPGYKDISTFG